jgi:hypothetical protein
MPKQSSRRLTEQERAERRRHDRERMQQAARELLSSDGWARWVKTRAKFHSYSAGNCMLLAAQCHQRGIVPTRIAGFRTWLKLGRSVRKGETALRILAPVTVKERDKLSGEESDERRRVQDRVRVRQVISCLVSRRRRRPVLGATRSVGLRCVLVVAPSGKGGALACAVVAEPAPEGDGAAAIARASRRYPRGKKRDGQALRIRRRRVPFAENFADRRQAAEALSACTRCSQAPPTQTIVGVRFDRRARGV